MGNVIASIIFVFLMVFTISQLYLFSFNLYDDYNFIAAERFQRDFERMSEAIDISGASFTDILGTDNDNLTITVVNNGGSTAHLVSLWVINETAVPAVHTRFDLDAFVPAGGTETLTDLSAAFGARIRLRLISELGSILTFRLAPASQVPNLRMDLVASPPSVIGQHDVRVTLTVINNSTEFDALYDLRINGTSDITNSDINYTYSASPSETITLNPPTPNIANSIRSGETVTFVWTYTVGSAAPGETFTFRGRYTGGSGFATSSVEVVTPFGTAGSTDITEVLGTIVAQISSFVWSQDRGLNWNNGFTVPENEHTIWRVNVTNFHLTKTIYLNEFSGMSFCSLDGCSQARAFFIVEAPRSTGPPDRVWPYDSVDDDGDSGTEDPVTVAPGETVTLYFAAKQEGDNQMEKTASKDYSNLSFVILVGTFDNDPNDPYGQTIPFISVRTV